MKNIILTSMSMFLSMFVLHATAADALKEISGTVTVTAAAAKSLPPSGVLYIFAKKASGEISGAPAAVLRIPQPKFPLNFTLSAANAMVPGTPFEGPFTITARLSPSGDAMDKSGPEGQDPRATIKPGQKDIKIELKPK